MADSKDYTTLFLIWLISTILIRTILTKTRTKSRLPPSPRALPIIGHLHHLSKLPHQAFHKLSNQYGPLMYFFLGSNPCIIVSSPEMAKECLKTNETSFLNRPRLSTGHFLTYGSSDLAMTPYGPHWRFMKKLCMNELLGGKTLEKQLPVRQDEIKQFLQLILKKAEAGESVEVRGELIRVTNNVITRMTMSQRCSKNDEEAGEVRKLVQEMNELMVKFNLSDSIWFCKNLDLQGFGKRVKEARERYDEMMERVIKEHEEGRRKKKEMCGGGDDGECMKDLLDILLDIKEDENSEMRLTRENIKAFILNMFGAGTDTSALTAEWALAELINNPNVMEKARREIDSVVGKGRLVEELDMANLPYLQAIVKETLRLHPTGPFVVRQSTENCTISGYEIPANTRLFVNVWAIGRDPKHWENPLEFRPERFISQDGSGKGQLDVRGQHFHFLPFGSGRRGCPGASLALHVVQLSLAAMIQYFDWKVSDAIDMEEGTGIALRKAHPLVCVPVARHNLFPLI